MREGDKLDREYVAARPSLRDLLTVVFKRRALMLTFLVTVMAATAIVALRMPKVYRVAATLFVNEARAEVPLAPGASQQYVINKVSEEDLNSEIEILKSRQLIEDVVETIGMDQPSVCSSQKRRAGIPRAPAG